MDFEQTCLEAFFEPHVPGFHALVHVDNQNPAMDEFLRFHNVFQYAFIPGQSDPSQEDDEDQLIETIIDVSAKGWRYFMAGCKHSNEAKCFHCVLIVDVAPENIRQFVAAKNMPGFVYGTLIEEAELYCL